MTDLKLIDAHCHVFSGADIPLKEYLQYGQGIPAPLAFLVALVVQDRDKEDEILIRGAKLLESQREEATGLIAWGRLWALSDKEITAEMLRAYPDVSLFTPAITDMDCWLEGHKDVTFYPDRVERHAEIARTFKGQVHPLIGFDPVRQHATAGDHLRSVIDAVEKQGFLGVKVYPPMGFRPIDNAALYPNEVQGPNGKRVRCQLARDADPVEVRKDPADPTSPPLTGVELDAAMLQLFDYCVGEDVPVMTHCTPVGAEAGPGRGLESDPRHWKKLLESNGGKYAGLRLNLAHFGGDTGRPSFLSTVGEILGTKNADGSPAYPNVYADVGAHDIVFSPDAERSWAYELSALLQDGVDWTKRILLGTDWPTIYHHDPAPNAYIQNYLRFMTRHFPRAILEDFMWKNALRFFGLSPAGKGRARLDAFYRTQGIPAPNWWAW